MTRTVSFGDHHPTDHGVNEEELSKPNGQGKTLCGRRLCGVEWFTRGDVPFTGKANFHCANCTRVLRRRK